MLFSCFFLQIWSFRIYFLSLCPLKCPELWMRKNASCNCVVNFTSITIDIMC